MKPQNGGFSVSELENGKSKLKFWGTSRFPEANSIVPSGGGRFKTKVENYRAIRFGDQDIHGSRWGFGPAGENVSIHLSIHLSMNTSIYPYMTGPPHLLHCTTEWFSCITPFPFLLHKHHSDRFSYNNTLCSLPVYGSIHLSISKA